jgi:hypothetical protein
MHPKSFFVNWRSFDSEGRILRFSTTGRPGALGACYVTACLLPGWQLPRLDFHQLADDSGCWETAFRAHHALASAQANVIVCITGCRGLE